MNETSGRAPSAARARVVLLTLTMILFACSGPNSAADVTSDQPPPPDQSAREALDALETTPDQDDELLALIGKFAIVLSKSGKTRRAFTDTLLKSLMRGKVSAKVIDPKRADFELAIRDATPKVLELFNELHGILTPEQRTKLIDSLAARFKDAEAKRKAHSKKMMDELDIGLVQKISIAQAMKSKMEAARPVFEEMKVKATAAGEAFKQNEFDANDLELPKMDLGKLALEAAVVLVATLAPELEYEQRRTLANIIRHRLTGGD